jgi:hypothetical protein
MKTHLVIDNYFDNPFDIRSIALDAKYYTKENHPGNIAMFPGYRTDYINVWNEELYKYLLFRQLENAKQLIDLNEFKEYWTKFSFSWTDKSIPIIEHIDFTDNWNGFKKFFGGVIYLHPTPPKNSGTIIKNIDVVENVFNRYVMYDAMLPHAIENSFGENLNDSRLVLTHFIYFK